MMSKSGVRCWPALVLLLGGGAMVVFVWVQVPSFQLFVGFYGFEMGGKIFL
jgi:hypothetical protein